MECSAAAACLVGWSASKVHLWCVASNADCYIFGEILQGYVPHDVNVAVIHSMYMDALNV
jgi:hypothetical protein